MPGVGSFVELLRKLGNCDELDSIISGKPRPVGHVENCGIAAFALAFAGIEGAKEVVAVPVMSRNTVAVGPFRDRATYFALFMNVMCVAETFEPRNRRRAARKTSCKSFRTRASETAVLDFLSKFMIAVQPHAKFSRIIY